MSDKNLVCEGAAFENVEIMDDFAERPWMGSQRFSNAAPSQINIILA
ncbi:hypothetical protein ACFO4O_11065 [Glaciecola siphonariae]|uniref:Uncharacterized protein n=1 Tax=Glaciecola siphonariae TaxID=521012 RepID=A0ABV9LVZ7_9ALTE